jgi:hypothetical protein
MKHDNQRKNMIKIGGVSEEAQQQYGGSTTNVGE